MSRFSKFRVGQKGPFYSWLNDAEKNAEKSGLVNSLLKDSLGKTALTEGQMFSSMKLLNRPLHSFYQLVKAELARPGVNKAAKAAYDAMMNGLGHRPYGVGHYFVKA